MNIFQILVNETFQILKFIFQKIAYIGFVVFPWQFFKVSQKQFLKIVHTLLGSFFLAFTNR
jgi:hypothetical protein